MNATPLKLQNGGWGAKVSGVPKAGERISITANSGKSWEATVERVLWTGEGISICSTSSVSKGHSSSARGNRAPHRRSCPNCGLSSCPKAWDIRDLCDED